MFQKNIYQVWYQGCDKIDNKIFIENKKNWELLNKDWNYKCLSNEDLRKACKLFSDECLEIYDSLYIMHAKIDLGRYVILYLYGGMYVDMDAYILRGLSNCEYVSKIINIYEEERKHVIGVSKLDLLSFEQKIFGKFNNAIMISSQYNPVLKNFINYILKNCKKYKNYKNNPDIYIQLTTGPYSFNSFFMKKDNLKDSYIEDIPYYVFEPCNIVGNCKINKDTISIHRFELSWLSENLKNLAILYFKYIRNYGFLIIIMVLLFIIIKKYKK